MIKVTFTTATSTVERSFPTRRDAEIYAGGIIVNLKRSRTPLLSMTIDNWTVI